MGKYLLYDNNDANNFFIQNRNDEDILRDNNENFNPLEFWQIKFIDCKKCNIKETQRFLIEFYKINVNKEIPLKTINNIIK